MEKPDIEYDLRIAKLRKIMDEEFGGKQARLAVALDRQPNYISRLFHGGKDGKRLGEKLAREFEVLLGKPKYFLDGDSFNDRPYGDAPVAKGIAVRENAEMAPPLRALRMIPVVGTAQGGDFGYYEEFGYPEGHGDGYIEYPTVDEQSYAVRVRGDSMSPRVRSGEFVIIQPNGIPEVGEDVLVKTKEGKYLVKQWLYSRDGDVTLASINADHKPITISMEDIEFMQPVSGYAPRLAFRKS